MKLKEQETVNPLDNLETVSTRINSLVNVCPFDLEAFYKQNKGLVKKYLRKNTLNLDVGDFEDVPDDWYYKNQEGILRHGIKNKPYSTLQQLDWIKCGLDVAYLAKKYVKIISIDDGLIPFSLYDFQEELLHLYQTNRFIVSMQCRQSGKTQTTATYIMWFIMFHEAKTSAILANKADQAQEILSRIQLSYESLPLFLQPGVRVYNKRKVELGNHSAVFSAASSSGSIRGKSISLLYIDEAAFIPNDMEFYESTYPTIASGKESQVIITSTPNGTRGLFYKIWTESEAGKNDFVRMIVTWDMVPGRDEEWKRQTIANTSEPQFRQEHQVVFRGSQNSLLTGETLEQMVSKAPIEEFEDGLKIYHSPIDDHVYIICVDVSRGVGRDYHAMTVIDISTKPYEVVATYSNNRLSPLLYPNLLYNIGVNYNDAYILVENNDMGGQVSNILYYDLEYENTLMTVTEKGKKVLGFGHNSETGVRTTQQVKAIGCSNIKTMIEKEKIIVNDMKTIDEFGTFIPHGKSYEADSGAHDDMVMTLVLFAWATTQSFFIEMTDSDFRQQLLEEQESRAMESISPLGIIEDEFGTFDGSSHSNAGESFGFF